MDWRDFIASVRGRQKVYIWDNNKNSLRLNDLLHQFWSNSVPEKNEIISLWNGEKYLWYQVISRVFCVNTPRKNGCWNLYVEKVFPVDVNGASTWSEEINEKEIDNFRKAMEE